MGWALNWGSQTSETSVERPALNSGRYRYSEWLQNLNDLNIFHDDVPALFKHADDSTIIALVSSKSGLSDRSVELFLNWSRKNNMICNLSKCKELVVRKKNDNTQYEQICNIPHCNSLSLLGVTLQSNCKFSEYVRLKSVKPSRCLHVLSRRTRSFSCGGGGGGGTLSLSGP